MSELNYAGSEISGFGSHSAAEVEQLQKALGLGGQGGIATGEISGGFSDPTGSYASQVPGAFTAGNALAVEDLDRTLKLVTFGLEHLRLWKDILKERVPQVVHEYNVQNAYGESDASPFFQMGSTPIESDAQYNRDVVQIKYLGTRGAVLHNLTLIQAAHGPVVAREVKNKTIELLARNERAMFDASASIGGEEYDGLENQIIAKAGAAAYNSVAFENFGNPIGANSIVLDAAGADFDEDIAEDAALIAVNNFGMPMDMYLGTDIHSAFSRAFYAKQRTVPGESLTSGNRVKEHMGTLDYRFKPSLFNRPRKTSAFPAASNPSDIGALRISSAVVGGLDVMVIAVNGSGEVVGQVDDQFGTSAISIDTIAAGSDILYLNIYTRATGGGADAVGYEFLKRVPNATETNESVLNENYLIGAAGGVNGRLGTASISRLAGTGKAFLLMHDPDVLCWKQLGSMIKYDLAVTTTQYEWLQLLYGTPLVMAPRKNVIVSNLRSESRNV